MIPLKKPFLLLAASAAFVLAAAQTQAGSWTATGPSSFGNMNYDGTGAKMTYSGGVFSFVKPAGAHRCEAHGASGVTITQGRTYTIQWDFNLTSTADNNAIFQMKAYGSPMVQNYPFVLKCIGGNLCLQYSQPSGGVKTVETRNAITANTWHTIKLQIYISNSASSGWISYWLDGSQKLNKFKGKTFDGDQTDPKWGVYGGDSASITDKIRNLSMTW
jgi:hypothetical protein